MNINPVSIGDELRNYVFEILQTEGHKVTREARVNTKKVDLLLELDDEYTPSTIAIECKNLGRNLSQSDINRIYADHYHLIEQGYLTDVYIITSMDFSPEAKNYARAKRDLSIFSLQEFEEKRFGFRKYCREVRRLFEQDGLDGYYIDPKTTSGEYLHKEIMQWIASSTTKPVAILGGYGMGKTSYCRYLVRVLADEYLRNPQSRIPVYVRLSDIATQSDLDGLIAKTLAGRYKTTDYSFTKFINLNKLGKFVVIFDGFDEMKHALSWSDFKYNFSQIHRLIEGNSKILVVGRPNAFLSDDEHLWALRGSRRHYDTMMRIPGAPSYQELQIQAFSDDDVTKFLRAYLLRKRAFNDSGAPDQWLEERLADFHTLHADGNLSRPVHLRIYADIAADPDVVLRNFSSFELYDIATRRIGDREGESLARKNIDSDARIRIIEDIAWWLWTEFDGRKLNFSPEDVPAKLLIPYNIDSESEYSHRDIFSGAFIERKFGENYFFAHRSFLEFFIARRLMMAREHAFDILQIFKALNPEILHFLRQSPRFADFIDYVYARMNAYQGEVPIGLLHDLYQGHLRVEASTSSSFKILMDYYPFLSRAPFDEKLPYFLLKAQFDENNEKMYSARLYLTFLLFRQCHKPSIRSIAMLFLNSIASFTDWRKVYRAHIEKRSSVHSIGKSLAERAVLHSCSVAESQGAERLTFDPVRAFSFIRKHLSFSVEPAEGWEKPRGSLSMHFDFEDVFSTVSENDRNLARKVLVGHHR